MSKVTKRPRSVFVLYREEFDFNEFWKKTIVNGRTIYTATSDRAKIKIYYIKPNLQLVPTAIEKFKVGRRIVIDGSTVYLPPRTVISL